MGAPVIKWIVSSVSSSLSSGVIEIFTQQILRLLL